MNDHLPPAIQRAAADVHSDADDDAIRNLIQAFGPFAPRNVAHRRATWLCILSAKRLVTRPGTAFDPCASDDHVSIAIVQEWIANGVAPNPAGWDRLCNRPETVHEVGELANESDSISNAVCSLARFSLHCGRHDAVEAIEGAWLCESEWSPGGSTTLDFAPWLTRVALPAAYDQCDLSPGELHPLNR